MGKDLVTQPANTAPTAALPVASGGMESYPVPPPFDPDEFRHGFAVDRLLHAWQARLTGGLAPAAVGEAFADWSIHLLGQPGKQTDLVRKAARKWLRYLDYCRQRLTDEAAAPAIEPLPGDRRFTGPQWQTMPFSMVWQGFLLTQQWWHNATTGIRGADPRHLEIVHFAMRQVLDALSPSNFLPTNPEVLSATVESGGRNLVQGSQNFIEDYTRLALGRPPVGSERYRVGHEVGITPGKVVFRNRLMELIRYDPVTPTVYPEPVLIVPAWIMKYYILDLSPANSLVRHLVAAGHTVFMISWKNPTAADRDLGMDDYLEFGPLKAISLIRTMLPGAPKIHAAGYCLGGTLLTIAAAVLARRCDDCLRTLTLLAAQADFTDAGELTLFINDSQVAWLEDMMWDQGYLDTRQMAGAFQLLRSNDLIWSTMVRQYLLGKRMPMSDLMAWNADATRMPFKMHSEYLRGLFLDNNLAAGRHQVRDEPVSLADIKVPVFAVSTTRDHVAPWKSVYKITWLTHADTTFVLASGGHNAGIVSPPSGDGDGRRSYRIGTISKADYHVDAEQWLASATIHNGSWWPAWEKWLQAWSGDRVAVAEVEAAATGHAPLVAAPGVYVLEQ